jgi:predicted membrane metal-binding protein
MGDTTSTLLNIFIILFLIWLVVLIIAIYTLFRRKDMPLPIKAFWAAVLFFAPVVGLIFYLIYGAKRNNRNDITRY